MYLPLLTPVIKADSLKKKKAVWHTEGKVDSALVLSSYI